VDVYIIAIFRFIRSREVNAGNYSEFCFIYLLAAALQIEGLFYGANIEESGYGIQN